MAWPWLSSNPLSLFQESYPAGGPFFSLTTAFLFLFSLFYYYHYHLKPSRRPGIPTNYPLFGMLPSLLSNTHRFHDWDTGYLRASGRSFFFRGPWFSGMDFLATCDPANIRHIFTTNFTDYPKGKELSEKFDVLGGGIFTTDGEPWRSQRLKAQMVMTTPKFRAFAAAYSRDKMQSSLLPFLSHAARNGKVIDLHDAFLRLTFDMTTNLVFGMDPGCLSISLPEIPFARAIDDAMETLFFRHTVPTSCWKLMRRLKLGQEGKMAAAWEVIGNFVAESVRKRRQERSKPRSHNGIQEESVHLLSSYIDEHHDDEGSKVDDYLRDTAVNFMLAGRDTTGSGMAWFLWVLCKNPHVEEKILQELESIPTKIQTPDGMVIFNSADLDKLVYLHAALCESLRLYPPVPFESKEAARSDVLPSGFKVAAGTKITVSIYAMGRMEEVWGKDCLEFRPERWIMENGKLRYEPSYKFVAFNTGPRTCLGKETAFIQMKAAVAAMVYNFQAEVVEGHVVQPKLSIILQMKNGLMVRVKKRPS